MGDVLGRAVSSLLRVVGVELLRGSESCLSFSTGGISGVEVWLGSSSRSPISECRSEDSLVRASFPLQIMSCRVQEKGSKNSQDL